MNSGNKRDPLEWDEISTEHIVQDEWIDFRRSAYRFPNGNVFKPFYSYSRRDFVVIVAIDTEGNYICVRQFRQGIKRVTTEFPAGGIERKDGKEYDDHRSSSSDAADNDAAQADQAAEDALEAAKRELLEETGYESDDWSFLLRVPSNATIADNYAHLFLAKNCRKVSGQSLDETEFLNVVRVPADKLPQLVRSGEFPQAVHILAWKLA